MGIGEVRRRWLDPQREGPRSSPSEEARDMATILWIIAAILVIWGIVTLVRGGVVMGIVLIVLGLLVGPGGVSIFT